MTNHNRIRTLLLLLFAWISVDAINSPRPVTPDASGEAKALLNFLYSINGEKVLAGQQGMDEVEYIKNITGRYPAIKGFDLIHENENEKVIQSVIDWWHRGGIPTVMWHWGAPGKGPGYENSKKEIDIERCFIKGTVENKAMWSDLRRIADWLTILRDANVPVLWRPMHECDGNWFWYGKGTGEQFAKLWRTMFNYFIRERKLNNLIWVLCHSGQPLAEFNPGEEYYDIAGADSYSTKPVCQDMYEQIKLIHGSERPIPYHECGTIPDPDLCMSKGVNWSWWMLWSKEYVTKYDKEKLKKIYNHDLVLTLDELPPIMDYLPDFPNISENIVPSYFPLVQGTKTANIFTDKNDFPVIQITAKMLADDIERVTGHRPSLSAAEEIEELPSNVSVIAGTIGKNRIVDKLIEQKLIDVSDIKGKWESFILVTIKHPIHKNPILVIVGSDRRGTAFGLTSLSEAIGVSPWYWWADVTPKKKRNLFVEPGRFKQGEPSVKYRGIFINDERFGGWAKWVENTFDKESGEVGPKVYRQVFELLLRLKGNYLWPAMHNGSKAFNANPENARLADEYAIVMGSSHCEQMLRNNEDEWKNAGIYGDFNYVTNRPTMIKYWEERVKTNGKYENIYTLGLRGIHDYPMEGATTDDERTALIQQAINDQRDMLSRHIKTPVEQIPQILCTYEEVLDAYHNGLKVPDDVTLLWCDDKHGYTRNLSNPEEQKRKGGAGIYYHLSYHGDPASWIWLSPLSPAFISTELTEAYTFGARKIWIFNVGDIKPAEKEISFAMELAWNIDKWKPDHAHSYIKKWATATFGRDYAEEIAKMQDTYYKLMASGKDAHVYFVDYSLKEIEHRINEYRDLANRAMALMRNVPDDLKDAYFELVLYPIRGAAMLNEYQLLSRRSLVHASSGDSVMAMNDALRVKQMYRALNEWTCRYNKKVCNGKWDNFFRWTPYHWYESQEMEALIATPELIEKAANSLKPRFLPTVDALSDKGAEIKSDIATEVPVWIKAISPIQHFSKKPEDNVFCRVIAGGKAFDASATPINNIWHATHIGPMWSKVGIIHLERGDNRFRITDVKPDARIDSIFLGLYPPFPNDPKIIIPASAYQSKHDSKEGKIMRIRQLGFSDGVLVLPFDIPSYEISDSTEAPFVEYSLNLQKGVNCIEIRTLPTLHVYEGRDARYAVSVDGKKATVYSIQTDDFSAEWRCNVLRGYSCRRLHVNVSEAGCYALRFYFMDPGIVLQEIRVM